MMPENHHHSRHKESIYYRDLNYSLYSYKFQIYFPLSLLKANKSYDIKLLRKRKKL